jgi:hypothetical protein
MRVDLRIQVAMEVAGYSNALDIVDEVKRLVEERGWDPEAVVTFDAETAPSDGRRQRA